MNPRSLLCAPLLALVASFTGPTAHAAAFPGPESYEITLHQNGQAAEIFRAPGFYQQGSVVSASAFASPFPLATASATSVRDMSSPAHRTDAGARLAYELVVNGPQDGVAIPLFVQGRLHAEAQTELPLVTFAGASLSVVNSSGGAGHLLNTGSVDYTGPDLTVTLPFTQLSGEIGFVLLQAVATAVDGGSASAWVDPYFFIDPDFLAANPGYSVTLSPGVVNAVPLPGALALLGSGLALLAAHYPSRRRAERRGMQ
ncbi:MAG: hypothetical protein AB7I32_15840 [Gammaproteobacteria bacterium]